MCCLSVGEPGVWRERVVHVLVLVLVLFYLFAFLFCVYF
jgi:hypothetical protein